MRPVARGLRNCNPLNIRKNTVRWKGLSGRQTDADFFVFTAPEWGYRAAFRTLMSYRKLHGLRTLRECIYRWAPPCENSTETYLKTVVRLSGVDEDTEIPISDEKVMCRIVAAMSYVENGEAAVMDEVRKGWKLLYV